MDKTKALENEAIGKLMWRFFVPAFIGVIANALYNIVDRVFIGQGVGSLALSAIGVIFPVMLIVMGFGMLIGVGAGVLVSIRLGERNREGAEQVLGTTLLLILIVSTFIVLVVFLIKKPLLESFGATAETLDYANSYLNIILLGTFFTMPGYSLNNMIRSEGNARIAMYSMLLSASVNIVLDYLFIMVFKWGVEGAAWATVISMFVLFAWVFIHFRSSRSVINFRPELVRFDRTIAKSIIAIGMAPFAMQIASSVVQGLANKMLIKYGGDIAVGALSIVISVVSLVVMSVIAINMAAQPIIGFNFGAKVFSRVKKTLRIALISATLVSIFAWIFTQFFPEYIIMLFNDEDPLLLDITLRAIKIITMTFPIIGFQIVAGNYFQAVGNAKTAIFLTLLRQVLVLIPLLFFLPGYFQLDGIWFSFPVSDVVSALVVLVFMIREWHRLTQLSAPATSPESIRL
ncbi:MATE family efflux transporter [Saccharicrinis sp. FJH54]|uniref:MATE family efflux transporter n=1 Tax=Saccharicrinis sp. FJH54 TaxID=3344665 RepID=UPI0035D45C0A